MLLTIPVCVRILRNLAFDLLVPVPKFQRGIKRKFKSIEVRDRNYVAETLDSCQLPSALITLSIH